jgi:hypothetical protein
MLAVADVRSRRGLAVGPEDDGGEFGLLGGTHRQQERSQLSLDVVLAFHDPVFAVEAVALVGNPGPPVAEGRISVHVDHARPTS